jgi:hypothetical protein
MFNRHPFPRGTKFISSFGQVVAVAFHATTMKTRLSWTRDEPAEGVAWLPAA